MKPLVNNLKISLPQPRLVAGFLLFTLLLCICSPGPALADSAAKSKYMAADTCYKKLRRSAIEIQKVSGWLNCIGKYEEIYKVHPTDSWAPAGMFKAAELYFQLHQRSSNRTYETRGRDLLARIKNKYPQSAYSGRARQLEKTMEASFAASDKVKRIQSKKSQTRDDQAIAQYQKQADLPAPEKSVPVLKPETQKPAVLEQTTMADPVPATPAPPLPNGDTRVTGLRFWSNPEYTRIVINADAERPYSHRLLKKDPSIDKPYERLYIDIEKTRLGEKVAEHTPINDNLLNQARAGQYQPHTVRVVVDIKSFENYKIFSLKDPFRIVIDVWGEGGKAADDPMTAMQKTLDHPQEKKPNQDLSPKHRVVTDNLESSDIARQLALGVQTIVIDPGHGGKDPGAPGYFKGVWEKDITLKLATSLADKLRDRLQCTVILTRTTDKTLTLEERTAIANTERADLFISLHCNAARNKKLAGFETYILNLATDDQAIAVAARENATSRKNISDLEYILSDLMKHAKIEESSRLANDVHRTMVKGMQKNYSGIKDLGVKQAPFYVLLGARMPSILIEASFLSNKTECKRLMTAAYRDDISEAIAKGVEKYISATNPKQL